MRMNNFRFSKTNFCLDFKFSFGKTNFLCKIHTLLVFSYQYLISYDMYVSVYSSKSLTEPNFQGMKNDSFSLRLRV